MKVLRSFLRQVLPPVTRKNLKSWFLRIRLGRNLTSIAEATGSDKAGSHFYTQHYLTHFLPLRKKRLLLLEIGIGGYQYPHEGGNSLRMWKAFFPKARIVGVDIHDKSCHEESRIQTFMGSQTDESFLKALVETIGAPDIIIDDGSHLNSDVIKTFTCLFPLLKTGGYYVVEDIQTSYWDTFGGIDWGGSVDLNAKTTSVAFFKTLIDGLNHEEFLDPDYQSTYFDRHVFAIHFYHNLIVIHKKANTEGSNLIPAKPGNCS